MIGTSISHYKILDKLGEGGMGVVYKARDLDLDRIVALKFLPDHSAVGGPERERFMQEARSAAALNHPNICTIYGIEKDGDRQFIAMEFVEGGTLRQQLPFAKLEDAVGIAIQVGEGLLEAHAKGIVHRDIKADNIMVTPKGQVKVMDFGLAKLKGSFKLTRTSGTVGTLGYMAPEQIQGGEVDLHADIFSFGVLLFEMLTGQLPFRGEHEAAMIYSIVNEEPRDVTEMRTDAPPMVVNLIQRCLEKDPADRFQHMDDVTSELRRTQKKTSGKMVRSSSHIPAVPADQPTPSEPVPHSTGPVGMKEKKNANMVIGGAALALLAAAVIWWLMSGSGPELNTDLTTRVLPLPYPEVSYSSISADGNWIAFPAADAQGKWDIYYSHISGREPKRITNEESPFIQQNADISPDGSQVAYLKLNTETRSFDAFVVSSLGGQSRRVASTCIIPRWRPDGARIGFVRGGDRGFRSESGTLEIWSVNPEGTDERQEFVDTLHVWGGRFSFCWSADGKSIGWIRSVTATKQVLMVRNLADGSERQLTDANENLDDLCWTKHDDIVFSSNRGGNTNLWMIHISGGEPVQITKGGGPDLGLSVSQDGQRLLYLQQQRVGNIWLGRMDGGEIRQLTFDEANTYGAVLSPDKSQIAFVMDNPDPLKVSSSILLMDRNGGNRRVIVPGDAYSIHPVWSPDGRWIAYAGVPSEEAALVGPGDLPDSSSRWRAYVIDAVNPGPPRQFGHGIPLRWVDTKHVQFGQLGSRNYVIPVDGSKGKPVYVDSTLAGPFGKYLLYYDLRTATHGWWIGTMPSSDIAAMMSSDSPYLVQTLAGPARRLKLEADPTKDWMSGGVGFLLHAREGSTLWKFDYMKNIDERVKGAFPGFGGFEFHVSQDGTELVYKVERIAGKLVVIENLYR